jgi:hypothetical protein
MKSVGRLLQIFGLVVLPAAMFIELTGMLGAAFGTRKMLVALVFGVAAFYLGRLIEGYSQR